MTRQPAAEKRFTVAWPIPREAPVSSSTRRGPFCALPLRAPALVDAMLPIPCCEEGRL
jgi:hypothetical protein